MSRFFKLVVFVGCPLLVVSVGFIVSYKVGLEEGFTAALTTALVCVTAAYAFFAFQLVEQQVNSAAPVVMLEAGYIETAAGIAVFWLNIGKGPALNFRCWVEDEEHPGLRRKAICYTAIAVALNESMSTLYIRTDEIPGYRLGIGYIRAQYESTFNITYESCLFFPENAAPKLKYGKATEIVFPVKYSHKNQTGAE